MFKILVADDEKFIRKGIISILERNIPAKLSITEAANGLEALEMVAAGQPDLVITDINMPGCNGLEFIRGINEKQVNTTVIVLSGYENFEYAKEAITLGVKEYITKPIKKTEFIEVIQKYMKSIQQKRQKTNEELERKMENNRMIEGVKKDLLIGLLKCSDNKDARQYLQQLKELNINFESRLYICVLFQYEVSDENREVMDFVVRNILDEYLSLNSEQFLMSVTYDFGRTIAIFKSGQKGFTSPEGKTLIRNAARLLREYGKVRVFAGIADAAPDFEYLGRALRHALTAAEHKIFERGDIVCAFADIEAGEPVTINAKAARDNVLELWGELNRVYRLGQTQSVVDALKSLYNRTMDYVQKRIAKSTSGNPEAKSYRAFLECWSLDEIKKEIKCQLERLEEAREETTINVRLMDEIVHYVDEHITDDLDLNTVAAAFNRSSGYVSTMFKRYADGGFNAYVTAKRIAMAKRLLKDQRNSIQDVAEACGYFNAKYFSVVFKKCVGQTPREYREKSVQENYL